MCKIIGIVSLKGGVGKTSLTAALGHAMSEFGKKVLLVDGNLSAPNLGLHFNIVNPEFSLHDVLDRVAKPTDAIYPLDNFDLLPSSVFGKLNNSTPLKLKDRIGFLKNKYDVIILDSSPNLDDETLGVIMASDEILVVSTPDHPTLSNTISAVKFAKQRGTPIAGIILNRVYGKNFELSLKDIEDVTDVPVMAVIPHDINVLRALSNFEPLNSFRPRSKGSEEIRKLAALLIGERYDPPSFRKFFGWVNPEKQEVNRQVYYNELFR
jgi:septum site-determining protein MinD